MSELRRVADQLDKSADTIADKASEFLTGVSTPPTSSPPSRCTMCPTLLPFRTIGPWLCQGCATSQGWDGCADRISVEFQVVRP